MDSSRNHYGHGDRGRERDRGGQHFRGGGGRGGGFRGGGNRPQPYRGGGRTANPHRSNRFGGQPPVDPEIALLRQISSFVSRVGEFQNLRSDEDGKLRNVEYTAASNINDLLPVLCAPDKLDVLLKYSPDSQRAEEKVGKLVHLVVSCVADLPMQTPCYAALTLAVHEQVKGNAPFEGFAKRCLQYVMMQIAKELDTTLLTSNATTSRSTCRLKLYLRYLCILANIGVVVAHEGESSVDPTQMTVFGFISVLVDAASATAEQFNNPTAGYWLALVVLSTVPYLSETIPHDEIEEKIRKPLGQLLSGYMSSFTPGTGITALLLNEPQVEEGDEAEEEAEDDDESTADGSGQICDSLQDLLRATNNWRKEGQTSRFALPMDAPWKGLTLRSDPNPDSDGAFESRPIAYSDSPLYLSFPQECQLLNLLLSGTGSDSPLRLQFFSLEGAVFGRLPIFGSPPDPEDEEDEEMEDGASKNDQLEAFRSMSLLDRYFVAESLRDCLLSHESEVNPSGLQFGSAKSAAEELLRVCHVFSEREDEAGNGIEYAILETIFALLAQSNEYSSLRHIYLTRVLLELVRLEPSRITQALMVAITNLFQDYLPALTPTARDNFGTWFAFHLTNTDYQWPSAYWQLWEPYATSDQRSSRGEFLRKVLQCMADNTCDPTILVKQALGGVAQSLAKELLGRSMLDFEESPAVWLEAEVQRRVWDSQEDATTLLDYMLGSEVGSALDSAGANFARTDALIRAVLGPARQLHEATKTALDTAARGITNGEDDMEDDSTFSKDVYVLVTTALQTYTSTLVGVLEKDAAEIAGDRDVAMIRGGAFLLRRAESILSWNLPLLESFVVCAVQNRVVQAASVFKWVLRDFDDSVVATVLPCWSRITVAAIRETVILIVRDETAGGIMTIDNGEPDNALAGQLLEKVGGLLHYSIERACVILSTAQLDERKLHPVHVDIVEGVKALLFASRQIVRSALLRPVGIRKSITSSDVEELFSKSNVTGAALAARCYADKSSAAVVLLKKSLELSSQ